MKGQYTSDFRPTIVQFTCMLTSAGVRNQHFRYWLSGFSTPLSAGKFIGANCFEKMMQNIGHVIKCLYKYQLQFFNPAS